MIIWILEFSWFGYLISVEFLEGDVFDQSFYVACWFQFCAIKLYGRSRFVSLCWWNTETQHVFSNLILEKHDFLDIALPKSAGTQSTTGVNVVLINTNEYLYY